MWKSLMQTKVYTSFFNYVWKDRTHKPSKVAAAKNFFSNVYVINITSFD